ncbi:MULTISPECIES: MerR family transcriptional regulator [unclassified Streptomyces]|uniref:MerR family transcriptional regulator n=1 Tax=unclassified Streptomyces TaxID=2593676 RepID=UPI002365E4EC|nr:MULTISPECIES: MerR family transcriptional regulator [unclassified Streptomyces]MDF3143036.1 MerR family transcriptional regulator [Streptomyces sp. T21Q-yed]WDF42938.1 MerR family transcriptional regulator [Streptomyces sp. T12]
MTTDTTEGPTLTIDELAARAGVTVRTVRFYGTKGLLPPPVIGPRRVGHYGREHLGRLALIEELQQQGMTLAAIERYLHQLPPDLDAHDLAIHRAVVASWAPEAVATVTRAELEQRAGRVLGDDDVERLAAMGVVEAGDRDREGDGGADGSGYYRVDLGLLRLGVGLLDVPLSQEAILAARKVLIEHSRAAAHELSQLFRGEVSERAAQDVKSLSASMHPVVVQALLTAFQRSLREELTQWLGDVPGEDISEERGSA